MPNPKQSKSPAQVLVTGLRFCALFPKSKLEERRITQILSKAGLPNVKRQGYELMPAIDAVLAHFKSGYEARDAAGEGDRARKNRAEADIIEVDRARQVGDVCLSEDYRDNYRDAIARGVQGIEACGDLSEKQKAIVIGILQGVTLPELETTE